MTLALGLGANTAIFSVVKAVLLAPLPYPEPDRLAFVWGRSGAGSEEGLSFPDFLELRENNRSFAGLALVRSQSVNLTGGESPERVTGTFTTASLFETVLATRAASRPHLPGRRDRGRERRRPSLSSAMVSGSAASAPTPPLSAAA